MTDYYKLILFFQECGASYVTKTNLNHHIRRAHTNVRPFVCTICNKGFSQQYELTSHTRKVHCIGRPWKCNMCPNTYKSSSILQRHIRNHSGNKIYKCEFCNHSVRCATYLTEHYARNHRDEYNLKTNTHSTEHNN